MTPSCPGTYCPARDLCARYDDGLTVPFRAEWQPIATAPRDGTAVIGWSPLTGHAIVEWFAYENGTNGLWSTTDGEYVRSPSHWMPLPNPKGLPVVGVRLPREEQVKGMDCREFEPHSEQLGTPSAGGGG